MRCIGMSKRQIICFVRLEALNWCKTAVPAGLVLGIVTTWGLCAVLHFRVGEEFSNIPVFSISVIGIVCGMVVGIVTVWIAANAPAKRASKVSPVAAVSGNTDSPKRFHHVMHTGSGKIETLLGINHAVSMKKNLILMTGSFALSIILFLSFSVIIDFVGYLMPQSVASSDIDIAGDNGNSIPSELLTSIRGMKGVKEVYGRRSIFEVPASFDGDLSDSCTVDLISYDDFDLQSLKKDNNLKNDPFTADGLTNGKLTLITSSDTFVRLTGEKDYSLVMVQTTKDATDKEVQAIQAAV